MTLHWRKSSHSGGAIDSSCVELALLPAGIGVRDSKHPTAGHLTLTPTEFTALLTQTKHGTHDR